MRRRSLLASALLLAALGCRDEVRLPSEPTLTTHASAVLSDSWVTRANLPNIERWGLTSAVVPNSSGQSISYAIGGSATEILPSGTTTGTTAKVHAYNVATNAWVLKRSMPLDLYKTNGTGVIDGKIYVSGGRTAGDKRYQRALLVYDPVTNTWTRKRDMPTLTWGGVTGVIGRKLYVLTCEELEDCRRFNRLALYRYDPATDQWSYLSYTDVELGLPMGGVMGGKLYATGGPAGALVAYDPVTNQWSTKAPMPRPRTQGAAVALGGKLYIVGGYEGGAFETQRLVRKTSVYDPNTNLWTNLAPMPTARHDFAASRVVVNGKPRIEAVGGLRPGNNVQYIP
jgi:N-acetylneuraminic acid mutarotase